ncbi:MAG: tripartite tricarboxylate transporter TctB family protein [Hyphomicrobiaceae bacterium]
MRSGWLVAAGGFLILFAGTAYLSFKLPLLDALGPGPGFFPLILALIGAVLALVLLAQLLAQTDGADAIADPDATEGLMPDRSAVFRLMGITVLLMAAFAVLDPLGYRLTALLFVTLLLLVMGVRNYLVIAAVALVASFGVFHSFYYWLKVPLPLGVFGL